MTYTKKQFLEDVKKEAVALKKNATAVELDRLDFAEFNPNYIDRCIYGLIDGGYCRSRRAVELITACCPRFMKNSFYSAITDERVEVDNALANHVNGVKSEEPDDLEYISAIEAYIVLPDANNKDLIDFLKGNRKDLVL